MPRRTFSLHTVRGLIASGLLAGAILAFGLVGWRLVLRSRGVTEAMPDEPEATLSAVQPQADLRERSLLIPVQGVAPAALRDNFNDARGGGLRVHHALDLIAKKTLELGGTITGEHGVGLAKKTWLREQMGDSSFDVMKQIKQALDPAGLLNPGKIFD